MVTHVPELGVIVNNLKLNSLMDMDNFPINLMIKFLKLVTLVTKVMIVKNYLMKCINKLEEFMDIIFMIHVGIKMFLNFLTKEHIGLEILKTCKEL